MPVFDLESSAVDYARYAVTSCSAVLFNAIAILSVILILTSFASFQAYVLEQQVNEEITTMFEQPLYTAMGLTLAGVTVNYEPTYFIFEEPVRVDVVVAHPAGHEVPPDIAVQIDNHLTGVIDKNFRVSVGFIETQQTA